MAELTFRARRILYATVTEYIATGEPVGSRRLSKKYGLDLSPATIRNVLADLEEQGYVRQPHTSAGRVPTDRGFRVFVNALVEMREVTAEERARVMERMRRLEPGEDVLAEAGELLSSLTGAAAVVTSTRPEQETLTQLRFMRLSDDRLLAVLVTRAGGVENRVVQLARAIDDSELERVNNLVAELLGAVGSLARLRDQLADEMLAEQTTRDALQARAKELVEATAVDSSVKMVIEGQGRLFERADFFDADKIRRYLRAFDDKERLLGLLERTIGTGGVRVLIGSEAKLDPATDVSLVTSVYTGSGTGTGSIGIIGPTRLDYAKVMPLVGFTAKVMSAVLGGASLEEAEDADDAED